MSDDEPLQDRVLSLARLAARRGRSGVKRRLESTRLVLERRQLEQDRQDFWVRLGKTAMRLTEQGEVSHPEIDRAIRRIRELQAEIDRLDDRNVPDDLAGPPPSD